MIAVTLVVAAGPAAADTTPVYDDPFTTVTPTTVTGSAHFNWDGASSSGTIYINAKLFTPDGSEILETESTTYNGFYPGRYDVTATFEDTPTPGTEYSARICYFDRYGFQRCAPRVGTRAASITSHSLVVGASNITDGSARLIGVVKDLRMAGAQVFEYGRTTTYGTRLTASSSEAGRPGSKSVRLVSVGGLQPETTYHYRMCFHFVHWSGRYYTDEVAAPMRNCTPDRTFTTAEPPIAV